jgi:L-glyceraldehyde 3-phosphate reductase
MLNRWIEEDGLLDTLEDLAIGSIVFSPLAQGMLTNKYLKGIPGKSRAAQGKSLNPDFLSEQTLANIRALNDIAQQRSQTLAQMAIAWVLRDARVTTALIGTSSAQQLEDCVGALDKRSFSDTELSEIDRYATEANINLWAASSGTKGPARRKKRSTN